MKKHSKLTDENKIVLMILQIAFWGGKSIRDEIVIVLDTVTYFFVVRMLLGVEAIHGYASVTIVAHASRTQYTMDRSSTSDNTQATYLLEMAAIRCRLLGLRRAADRLTRDQRYTLLKEW